jgi:hypothetical protein
MKRLVAANGFALQLNAAFSKSGGQIPNGRSESLMAEHQVEDKLRQSFQVEDHDLTRLVF